MRHTTVKASELGDDWRPEAHLPPLKTDLNDATVAGWERGARGTTHPRSKWTIHGRPEVIAAFWKGHRKGIQARKEFLESV